MRTDPSDERAIRRESLIEDAVDGIVQAIFQEAQELDVPDEDWRIATVIARRVVERFGFTVTEDEHDA